MPISHANHDKICQQKSGITSWDTYAPVAKTESLKFVLLLAQLLGLPSSQINCVTTFLNGPLDGVEIYIEQSGNFNDGSVWVFKLLQSLYGLSQAPRIWYNAGQVLRNCGFRRTKMDAGIYVRTNGREQGISYRIRG